MAAKFTPFAEYIKNRPEPAPLPKQDGFQIQTYNAGDTIFTMGSRGHAAYVVRSGKVEISIGGQGQKKVLTVLEEQAVFGEVALLTKDHTRSATAVALEDSEVIRIPKEVFEQYLFKSPKVISTCLVAIAKRLNEFSVNACDAPADLERIVRILGLLRDHDATRLSYTRTLDTLTRVLAKPEKKVADDLTSLEDFNLIEIEPPGTKTETGTITLLGKDRFMEKALKVIAMFGG
ncbi:MAG TPA: hypothetical protein DHV36_11210 [Desulfobacteraceae bacterium]|nr:hypothetical protein [Desulfobacteraceae bacterium]